MIRTRFAAIVGLLFASVITMSGRSPIDSSPSTLPVLFLHGLCSDSDIWWDSEASEPGLIPVLLASDSSRYSNVYDDAYQSVIVRLYSPDGQSVVQRDADGKLDLKTKPWLQTQKLWTLDFYDPDSQQGAWQDATAVANESIFYKGVEVKLAIDKIKSLTHTSAVILVAHSLGGLAARTYLESIAYTTGPSNKILPYTFADDVASLISIDTPHAGADVALWAEVLSDRCPAVTTLNKQEMNWDVPSSSPFLQTLNTSPVPWTPTLYSITSYRGWSRGDGIVTNWSQDLTSRYPSAQSNILNIDNHIQHAASNGCDNSELFPPGGPFTCQIHTFIHHFPETIGIVRDLIQRTDTLYAHQPAIARVDLSPSAPLAGQSFAFTLVGTNFDPASVEVIISDGPGCDTVAPCDVIDNPTLTAKTFTSARGRMAVSTPGTYHISVRNGSSAETRSNWLPIVIAVQSSTKSAGFSVQGIVADKGVGVGGVTMTLSGAASATSVSASSGAYAFLNLSKGSYVLTPTKGGCTFFPAASALKITSASSSSQNFVAACDPVAPFLSTLVTSPLSLVAGQPFAFVLNGSHFDAASVEVLFRGPGCAPCVVPHGTLISTPSELSGVARLNSTGTYFVWVRNGSGVESNDLTVSVNSNAPPTAGFFMTTTSDVVQAPGELSVTADAATDEGRVTFTDASFDPEGAADIVSRLWTTNTGCTPSEPPPCVLSTLSAFTWGFKPGGPYVVTLAVTDTAGSTSSITGTIVVHPSSTTSGTVWPISGHDAQRTSQSAFIGPTSAPVGAAWTFSGGAPLAGGVAISHEGWLYLSASGLYALHADGSVFAQRSFPSTAAYAQPLLTAPAIDDAQGFVYVGVASASSGWDLLRLDKQLQNAQVVFHGDAGPPSDLIVDGGSVFFSDVASNGDSVIRARGNVNWTSAGCSGDHTNGRVGTWFGAPTIGKDGSVYGTCAVVVPNPTFSSELIKIDRNTGAPSPAVTYGVFATDMAVDGSGFVRVGWWGSGGVFPIGGHDRFDKDLTFIDGDSLHATGRTSILPDGTSTIWLDGVFHGSLHFLRGSGAASWQTALDSDVLSSTLFSTNPSVDAAGQIFIGSTLGLVEIRSSDGAIQWTFTTSAPVASQPAISNDGSVYFSDGTGIVYALRNATTTGAAPHVASIAPPATVGHTLDLTINGTDFDASGAVDQVFLPDGTTLVGQGTVKFRSATRLVVTESLAGASPLQQAYVVKIKNPDGQLSNGVPLTLNDAVAVSPNAGSVGTMFTYTGAGFTRNTTATSHLKRPNGTEFATSTVDVGADGTFTATVDSSTLVPGFYQAWAVDPFSGKASTAATFAVGMTADLLPYQSPGYRYQVIGPADVPPSGFEQPSFNDSSWSVGTAAFGTCGNDCPFPYATIATPWPLSTQLLVRQVVNVPFDGTAIQMKIGVDNDVVAAWINGIKVSGRMIHDGAALQDDFLIPVSESIVHEGVNVVALQLRDRGGQSYFDMRVTLGPPDGSYWQVLDTGQAVNTLAIDPSQSPVIYAGSSGVLRSTDGGVTWQGSAAGMVPNQTSILSLAVDPSTPTTIYAGYTCDFSVACGGIYRSVDAGATWTQSNTGLTASTVRAIAIDPTAPAVIYAGNAVGEVSKSIDGGATWTVIFTNPGSQISSVAVDPFITSTIYAGTFGSGSNALFKSTDGGISWATAISGLSVLGMAVDPINPGLVYLATPAGLVRTSDRGVTQFTSLLASAEAVALNPADPAAVVASTVPEGAQISTNLGANWAAASIGLPLGVTVTGLAVDPNTGIIYGATAAGVVRLVVR